MTWTSLESTTLGEIVSRDFRAGAILDRYNLDYCCGGGRTLGEGCRQRGVSVEQVAAELEALDPGSRQSKRLCEILVDTAPLEVQEREV